MTVNMASEMQSNALPHMTLLDCILYHNTSMIQAFHQALRISAPLGACI